MSLHTRVLAAGLAGALTLAYAPAAHAASTQAAGTAQVRYRGVLDSVTPAGDGDCTYTATVDLRGRTQSDSRVQGRDLPMTTTGPCVATTPGDPVNGTGQVDFTGRRNGRNGPIRVDAAEGTATTTFAPDTPPVTGFAGFGAEGTVFKVEGPYDGTVASVADNGDGTCDLAGTGTLRGTTPEGYRMPRTSYEEIIWTVVCTDAPPAGAKVRGTTSGDATGTRQGNRLDIVHHAGTMTLDVVGAKTPTVTGFGSFGHEGSL